MSDSQLLAALAGPTPLIFGHRGAKAYAPANTLTAFELAVQQGAQGVELDVHRTRDGYPVIIHDFDVDNTTNGSGRVTDFTLAELKALDAGSWFDARFAGLTIPTLDEVFAAVGQQLLINVEIKSVTPDTDGVEQVTADCIRRHNMQGRVIVSSFNPLALKRFREIMPEVPLGFLYDRTSPAAVHELMQGFSVEALHPHHTMIDAALVAQARAAGQYINTWTVNEVAEAQRLAALGVHVIITDAPDRLREGLE